VVIGNFLYGLGVAIGGRLKSGYLTGTVSLLQQTPEDKALGDVLVSFPGIMRLIEFKAAANKSAKEKTRHTILSTTISCRPEMADISRKVHWYVETAPSEHGGVEAFFSPYLDAFTASCRPKQHSILEIFIQSLAEDALSNPKIVRPQQEKDYLKLVRWSQGVGETGAGALIVIVGSDGGLEFVALEDLMELGMSYNHWMEYRQEREHQQEKSRKIESKEKIIDMGKSL
jgi:hypothetical protein